MIEISNKCHKGLIKTLVAMLPLIQGDSVKDKELRRKVKLLLRELMSKKPVSNST